MKSKILINLKKIVFLNLMLVSLSQNLNSMEQGNSSTGVLAAQHQQAQSIKITRLKSCAQSNLDCGFWAVINVYTVIKDIIQNNNFDIDRAEAALTNKALLEGWINDSKKELQDKQLKNTDITSTEIEFLINDRSENKIDTAYAQRDLVKSKILVLDQACFSVQALISGAFRDDNFTDNLLKNLKELITSRVSVPFGLVFYDIRKHWTGYIFTYDLSNNKIFIYYTDSLCMDGTQDILRTDLLDSDRVGKLIYKYALQINAHINFDKIIVPNFDGVRAHQKRIIEETEKGKKRARMSSDKDDEEKAPQESFVKRMINKIHQHKSKQTVDVGTQTDPIVQPSQTFSLAQVNPNFNLADLEKARELSRTKTVVKNLVNAKLECADLSGLDLTGVNLTGANLHGAKLEGTVLEKAILNNTNLENAKLKGVNLSNALIQESNLKEVEFTYVDLTETKLIKNDMSNSKLTLCECSKTCFSDNNLSLSIIFNTDFYFSKFKKTVGIDITFANVRFIECELLNNNFSRNILAGKITLENVIFLKSLIVENKFINSMIKVLTIENSALLDLNFTNADLTNFKIYNPPWIKGLKEDKSFLGYKLNFTKAKLSKCAFLGMLEGFLGTGDYDKNIDFFNNVLAQYNFLNLNWLQLCEIFKNISPFYFRHELKKVINLDLSGFIQTYLFDVDFYNATISDSYFSSLFIIDCKNLDKTTSGFGGIFNNLFENILLFNIAEVEKDKKKILQAESNIIMESNLLRKGASLNGSTLTQFQQYWGQHTSALKNLLFNVTVGVASAFTGGVAGSILPAICSKAPINNTTNNNTTNNNTTNNNYLETGAKGTSA